MPYLNISKEMIQSLAEQENKKYIKNINLIVNKLFSSAISDLSKKISFLNIDKVVLQPANELISGAFVDGSEFVYLLGIQNVQLEINTNRKLSLWEKIKKRLKWAWENRKYFKRKRNKRKKKHTEDMLKIEEQLIKFDPSKYTIYNLTEDLQNCLLNYLSETSLVYMNGNLLHIIGKDDFGANTKIYVYVVNFDGNVFKIHDEKKHDFKCVDINERLNILEEKISNVGDNFIKILKIFNSLYYNINGYMCNQIIMESILCYCPDKLYQGNDIYKSFIKILNFVSIKSLKDVKSVNNKDLTIFQDELCNSKDVIGFNKMINRILNNKND